MELQLQHQSFLNGAPREALGGPRRKPDGKGRSLQTHLVILVQRRENFICRSSLHVLFKLNQPESVRFQEVAEPLSSLVATVPALDVKTKHPGEVTESRGVTFIHQHTEWWGQGGRAGLLGSDCPGGPVSGPWAKTGQRQSGREQGRTRQMLITLAVTS